MKKTVILLLLILLIAAMAVAMCACGGVGTDVPVPADDSGTVVETGAIDEDGYYTTKDDVALFINTYHRLPDNYVTENEAYDLGWKSKEDPSKYGIMIGGMKFGNREKLLPQGENYFECDVDYDGHMRGTRRLVYTKDGTVYYTDDHYESFTQLY